MMIGAARKGRMPAGQGISPDLRQVRGQGANVVALEGSANDADLAVLDSRGEPVQLLLVAGKIADRAELFCRRHEQHLLESRILMLASIGAAVRKMFRRSAFARDACRLTRRNP